MKRTFFLTIGLVAAVAFSQAHAAKLNVVTTTTMVTDMVKEIGGDRVKVVGLMGPGVDPHLYKPASGDVVKLQRAKIIFYSGLMLEGRMTDLFFRMARAGKLVYAVTESIPEKDRLEPPEFAGHWDPHVWMDIAAWSQCVDASPPCQGINASSSPAMTRSTTLGNRSVFKSSPCRDCQR